MAPKLVRDEIPAITKATGTCLDFRTAKPEEMMVLLRDKLQEEVEEFLNSDDLVELADVLEVVYALADHLGASRESLEQLRLQKAQERGAFNRGIVWLQVKE